MQYTRWILGALLIASLLLGACGPAGKAPAVSEAPQGAVAPVAAPTAEPSVARFVAESDGPAGFAVTLAAPDIVSLAWEAVEGAAGYELQADDPGGGFITIANLAADVTTFEDLMASEARTLTYRIETLTDAGPAGASSLQITTEEHVPNPLSIQPTYDPDAAVAARIGPDGGSLSLTNAEGTEFLLEIPAGVMAQELEVSMTPVTAIGDWPLDGDSFGAVRIEPDGLQLADIATLTITLNETGSPDLATVGYGLEGTGAEFHLVPPYAAAPETAGMTGSGRGARPAHQTPNRIRLPVIELKVHGAGQVSSQRASELARTAAPTGSGQLGLLKAAALQAASEKLSNPDRRSGVEIHRHLKYANDCADLRAGIERFQQWSAAQPTGSLTAAEIPLREQAMAGALVQNLKEQVVRAAEDCEQGKPGARRDWNTLCLKFMLSSLQQARTPFWAEMKIAMGQDAMGDLATALDACYWSYEVLETPGASRSWESNCWDNMFDAQELYWTGGSDFGTFLIVGRGTQGTIYESWHSDTFGNTVDYAGAGRYRIDISRKDANGDPEELNLVYTTSGVATICSAGVCQTTESDNDEAEIPFKVRAGSCESP